MATEDDSASPETRARRHANDDIGEADRSELDAMLPVLYDEMRRIAHAHLRNERTGHTLNTTSLVHEAYLRMIGLDAIDWQNRSHYLGMASRTMRRVLIDYARSRARLKRNATPGGIPAVAGLPLAREEDLLELDAALQRLETLEPRQCRIVECRFFAGMTNEETADALDISVATVKRDWTLARAWLNAELAEADAPGGAAQLE